MNGAAGSRHIAITIDRPVAAVYDYIADPANLPHWAAGLSTGIVQEGERWICESPMGSVIVRMAPRNDLGVVDHWVSVDGTTYYNPMRVLECGTGAEVVFTLRRAPGMTDVGFEGDAALIAADLATLRRILESG